MSVRILTIEISQQARLNFCSRRKNRYVRLYRVWFFSYFGHLGQNITYTFCTLALIWIIFFTRKATSSLSKRKSRKAFRRLCLRLFNIGLNWGTNYNTGLKRGFDLRIRSSIGSGISQILVKNSVSALGSGPYTRPDFSESIHLSPSPGLRFEV